MNNNAKIKILVCYYKAWELPKHNLFIPIQAGKETSSINLKMQNDNEGLNISNKNSTFGEFTAWYWAWKNIKNIYPHLEYIGLSHYRRFFVMDQPYNKDAVIHIPQIPKMENYENLFINTLENHDIILAKPVYFGCNIKTHYCYRHYSNDYETMKNVVHDLFPEYDDSFLHIFENNNSISLYCMFVSKIDLFNQYFEWLFPLLFEMERRTDVSQYEPYQKRVLAFLAERLLNVYVYHHKLNIIYEPIYFIDGKTALIQKIKNLRKLFNS